MEVQILLTIGILGAAIAAIPIVRAILKNNFYKQHTFMTSGNIYETDKIKIEVMPDIYEMKFTINNLGKTPIKLIWDDSCIVLNNNSYKVWGSGIELIDKEKPIKPSIIAPESILSDGFIPVNAISRNNKGQWVITPWFKTDEARDEIIRTCDVLFCIEIEDRKEYITLKLEWGYFKNEIAQIQ